MRRSCAVWAMKILPAAIISYRGGAGNPGPVRVCSGPCDAKPRNDVDDARNPGRETDGLDGGRPLLDDAVDRDLAALDGDAQLADAGERGGQDVDDVVADGEVVPAPLLALLGEDLPRELVRRLQRLLARPLAAADPAAGTLVIDRRRAARRHGRVGVDGDRLRVTLIARVVVLVAVGTLLYGAVVLVREATLGLRAVLAAQRADVLLGEIVLAAVAERWAAMIPNVLVRAHPCHTPWLQGACHRSGDAVGGPPVRTALVSARTTERK